jgi:hypothetical protein
LINHNLGTRPLNIEVVDSNYDVIVPESTRYIDSNTVKIVFEGPQTGWAALTFGEGSSGTSGSSGLTYASSGSAGSAGSSGSSGTSPNPAGAAGYVQYYATSSTLGAYSGFLVDDVTTPTQLAMNFPVYSSSGATGVANLRVHGTSGFEGTMTTVAIVPVANNTHDIGTSTMVYNDMYAVTFNGRATSANWSDLAERYESDEIYDPGTVLAIGGTKEVTLYQAEMPYAGVVSDKPGLRMNDGMEQRENEFMIFICLKGRIFVKIEGGCNKGDFIIAYNDGTGKVITKYEYTPHKHDLIGIALSNSNAGFVEVKV